AVHRYTPGNLLWSVHAALGWPAPKLFPDGNYPSAALVTSLGGYVDRAHPGFDTWDAGSMLAWQTEVGSCRPPPNSGPDWVDALVTAGRADPGATVEDLFLATRDRLLQDPVFLAGERDAVALLVAPLAGDTGATDPLELEFAFLAPTDRQLAEDAVRDYCGALLVSPQFVMGGLPGSDAVNSPRRVVCLPGEVCDEAGL